MPTQMLCADGRYVTTGFPPRSQRDFESLVEWIDTLGFRDEFPETMLLDLAVERGGVSIAEMATDDLARDIFGAATMSEVIELQSSFARKQFEAVTAQMREFQALGEKYITATTKPVAEKVEKTFKELKVA